MSINKSAASKRHAFPWLIVILMSSVTFVGLLSKLMPSGVLPQIMADLGINEMQGDLVGLYRSSGKILALVLVPVTVNSHKK